MRHLRFRTLSERTPGLSRRTFLKVSAAAGAGLTLGLYALEDAAQQAQAPAAPPAPAEPPVTPLAFIRIAPDNTVTVISKHLEMGQGTYTGLPTLIAEELDASWSQIRVEGAPADAKLYANLAWGGAQGTGGSSAIANSFLQYRKAGAAARAMLVAAAADQWKVAPESIVVKNGELSSGAHKATFGQLAQAAAKQSVPQSPKLKDSAQFAYIGKSAARTDSRAKSTGTATFTQDVKLPDMLTAVVAHPPRFDMRVKNFDLDSIQGMPGVRYVVQVENGVAVIGTSFWSVKRARDALKIDWEEASGFKLSSADILAEYKRLAGTPGTVATSTGDVAKALAGGGKTLEAAYEFPYLAHASMEPLNCVVKLTADKCEIWNGEQFQTGDQMAVAKALGFKPEQVVINQLFAGGSFGRRANPDSDYVLEAVSIAKAVAGQTKGSGVPVKLVWTREDDMRGGYYRPMYYHTIKAALDADGRPAAWQHRIVGQSILGGSPFEGMIKNGIDPTSVEGASNLPYAVPNLLVDLHSPKVGVPVQWWRSVGSTHTAYSTETFLDELAVAAGKDPVAYRRMLLESKPRHRGVLDLAAEKAGWDKPLAPGKAGGKRARGVAVHESFDTFVAQVVEITVSGDKFTVDRVVCAVDCGVAVNPDVIRAQMEGGIGFGLGAALYGAITLKNGEVEQSNFHNYQVLRINEMPAIEVHIVPSTEPPTGVGEPGVPPIAPAVANALAAATGKRLRKLPLSLA
jgi:isoquinoline 1-oxidoreductase beta subunit